jgi:hypothetical protein
LAVLMDTPKAVMTDALKVLQTAEPLVETKAAHWAEKMDLRRVDLKAMNLVGSMGLLMVVASVGSTAPSWVLLKVERWA